MSLFFVNCKSNYTNNTFDGNSADHDGGAVKWTGYEPFNLTTNNTFGSNSALYGNGYASSAVSIEWTTREDYDNGLVD